VIATAVIFLAGIVAGAINSIAGGGTLVSFPALLWLGRDPIMANATNTVAIWPGSLAGAYGFRQELSTVKRWLLLLVIPSLLGGALGGWLLLRTPTSTFKALVPWLILGATVLLAFQEVISRRLAGEPENPAATASATSTMVSPDNRQPTTDNQPPKHLVPILLFQFLVALYGGYFGAGMGILMLAALGLIGLTDMHQMNGLKNVLAVCINGIAAIYFVFAKSVNWNDVVIMMAGTIVGGFLGARLARRLGRVFVRRFVVAIGFGMALLLWIRGL
jgi:uncharacterized membrane protein YfcA